MTEAFETQINVPFDDAAEMVKVHHYSHDLPKMVRTNFGAYIGGSLEAVACYGPCVGQFTWAAERAKWLELRRLVKKPGSRVLLSKFLSATLNELKLHGTPAVISYADPEAGHHGGIYQATNWVHCWLRPASRHHFFRDEHGKELHPRTAYTRFGTSSISKVLALNPTWTSFMPATKHRYLMPLCIRKAKALAMLNTHEIPYPKPMWD